jgi:NAD(P)-dependent dehydrogenase (short-subunit alcohol dehydrogenase family)
MDLAGKTVVITGGAAGLGRAAARLMADKGARVRVLDVNADALAALTAEYPGGAVTGRAADITDDGAVAAALADLPVIHVLVNNASVQTENAFEDIDLREWRRTLDVNLTGAFICIRAALPRMPRGATIMNVLTHQGRRTNLYPYAASKAGLLNLTQNLAVALGDRGISVNALALGAMYSQRNAAWQDDPAEVAAAKARSPLGLMLRPEEAAFQLVSFIENAAGVATGALFDVSGGRSLR